METLLPAHPFSRRKVPFPLAHKLRVHWPMLKVESISRSYGRTLALDALSFELPAGSILGFVGPNGAGKTTAMSIITGLLVPDQGRVLLDGQALSRERLDLLLRVGFLPETPPLYQEMEVGEFLRFCADARKLSRHTYQTRVAEVALQTGLVDRMHQPINTLSRGYRQRVGLAQALLHDPDLLVLDEPTSGLDPAQIEEMHLLLRKLAAQGKTIIFSTHILSEVESVADHMLVINHGKKLAFGKITELLTHNQMLQKQIVIGLNVAAPDFAATLAALDCVHHLEDSDAGLTLTLTSAKRFSLEDRAQVIETAIKHEIDAWHFSEPSPSLSQHVMKLIQDSNQVNNTIEATEVTP